MTYTETKELIRLKAIEWQQKAAEDTYSYGELSNIQELFEHLAAQYGLVREFRENGII